MFVNKGVAGGLRTIQTNFGFDPENIIVTSLGHLWRCVALWGDLGSGFPGLEPPVMGCCSPTAAEGCLTPFPSAEMVMLTTSPWTSPSESTIGVRSRWTSITNFRRDDDKSCRSCSQHRSRPNAPLTLHPLMRIRRMPGCTRRTVL